MIDHLPDSVLDQERLREQRQAVCTLLLHPLLTAGGKHAEAFVLVRRHGPVLRTWFSKNFGWPLYIDSETARLRKIPVNLNDSTRGAKLDKLGKQAFSRRRYALFCLVLAGLFQGERQITLGRLFEQVLQMASGDPELAAAGLEMDATVRAHRRDLVDAVRLLLELGLLHHVDGETNTYIDGQGDVLYTINRSALSWVLNTRRSPSSINAETLDERLEAILAEPRSDSEQDRLRRTRWYLNRRLIDDPVLYFEQLNEEQRTYLHSQRGKILRDLTYFTGLHAEIRREGIALVDESGKLTDLDMPAEGTEGHITLLLAGYLANNLKEYGALPVTRQALRGYLIEAGETYGRYWRKDARGPEALALLLDDALGRLLALSLIRTDRDGVIPLPAIARYRLDEPQIRIPKSSQGELF